MFEEKQGETLTDAGVGDRRTSSSQLTPSGPTSTPAVGESLPVGDADRYTITDEYSRGGLGRILRAEDESLSRTVAVKELLSRTPSHEERFIREARITARLQHPSIVPVHEAGRWPSGDPYYVMKLIQGETLKQSIVDAKTLRGRLALLPNAIAVADAVAYAHSLQIIHRDLKPSNVMVGEFGETVVVDWGLAEDLNDPSAAKRCSGDIVGTPAYMPPEQARGELVDKRADVYSLGATIHHLLAGQPPYAGEGSEDRLGCVLAGRPTPIRELEPDLPPDLAAIVDKAMARHRDDRYRSAAELAADLKRFQTGKVVMAQEYSTLALLRRWLQRHRGAVAFTVVTISMFAIVGVLAVDRIINERNTARRERAQASEARVKSEARQAELLFLQAESSLLSDPTAAVAWLKEYPPTGPRADELAEMADQARALGVATDVFNIGEWVLDARFVGSSHLVTLDKGEAVRVWDLETGRAERYEEGSPATAGRERILAVSPSDTMFAYGGFGGQIKVVDLVSGEHRTLPGHDGRVGFLRFSPTGEQLISAGDDRAIRVWNIESGKLATEILGSRGELGNVSEDGSTLATLRGDLLRWRRLGARSWSERRVLAEMPKVRAIAVASARPVVAALTADDAVRIINVKSGETRILARGDDSHMVRDFKFSISGRYLSATGDDRAIRVWDLDGDTLKVLRGHLDSIYMTEFSADEAQLISASDDRTARLWDLRTGAVTVLRGHEDDVIRASFSSDGSRAVTASLDGTARVWPTHFDDSTVLTHPGLVAGVQFPRADRVVSQLQDGSIFRWSIEDGSSMMVGKAWPGEGFPDWERKRLAKISPAGQWAAALREDGQIDLWNIESGSHRTLTLPEGSGSVTDLEFSSDGEEIAVSDVEGSLVFWPTAGGEAKIENGDVVQSIAYAPDGSIAMVTSSELVIRDPTGEEVAHRLSRSGPAGQPIDGRARFYLNVSPHGDRVAAYRPTGFITVCGRAAGSCRDLGSGGETILSLAFSTDARLLAAACADRTVRLWNLETGEDWVLRGHADLVHYVEFAPRGNLLASSSYDKTIRLWNTTTRSARVLRGHGESVESISFSPTGDSLASASRDGTVRVWKVTGESVVRTLPAVTRTTLRRLSRAVISGERPISPTREIRARTTRESREQTSP